jgi:hypothetical protein
MVPCLVPCSVWHKDWCDSYYFTAVFNVTVQWLAASLSEVALDAVREEAVAVG